MVYYQVLNSVGGSGYLGLQLFVCLEKVDFKFSPCFLIIRFAVPILDVIGNTPVLFNIAIPLDIIISFVMY